MNKNLNILLAISSVIVFSTNLSSMNMLKKSINNAKVMLNESEAELDEYEKSRNFGEKTKRTGQNADNKISMMHYYKICDEYSKFIEQSIKKIKENSEKIKNTEKLSDSIIDAKNEIDSSLKEIRELSETFSVLNLKNNNELNNIKDRNNEKHKLKAPTDNTYLKNFNEKLELIISLDQFTEITKKKNLNDIKPQFGIKSSDLISVIDDLINYQKKSTDKNALEINKNAIFNQLTGKTKMLNPATEDIIDAVLTVWVKGKISNEEKIKDGKNLYNKIVELLIILSERTMADSVKKINLHGHQKISKNLTEKSVYKFDKEKSNELSDLLKIQASKRPNIDENINSIDNLPPKRQKMTK